MLDPNTVALLNQLGVTADDIESLLRITVVLTVLAVVAAIPTVILAARKHRSKGLWLVFALSIPVLPLLLIWLLPSLPPDNSSTQG